MAVMKRGPVQAKGEEPEAHEKGIKDIDRSKMSDESHQCRTCKRMEFSVPFRSFISGLTLKGLSSLKGFFA